MEFHSAVSARSYLGMPQLLGVLQWKVMLGCIFLSIKLNAVLIICSLFLTCHSWFRFPFKGFGIMFAKLISRKVGPVFRITSRTRGCPFFYNRGCHGECFAHTSHECKDKHMETGIDSAPTLVCLFQSLVQKTVRANSVSWHCYYQTCWEWIITHVWILWLLSGIILHWFCFRGLPQMQAEWTSEPIREWAHMANASPTLTLSHSVTLGKALYLSCAAVSLQKMG